MVFLVCTLLHYILFVHLLMMSIAFVFFVFIRTNTCTFYYRAILSFVIKERNKQEQRKKKKETIIKWTLTWNVNGFPRDSVYEHKIFKINHNLSAIWAKHLDTLHRHWSNIRGNKFCFHAQTEHLVNIGWLFLFKSAQGLSISK